MDMVFPPFYQESKVIVLCVMFFLFFLSFAKDNYLPLCYLIVLSFMPGTLFPFVAQIRFELIFFIVGIVLMLTKQKHVFLFNSTPMHKFLLWFFVVMFLSVFQAFDIGHSWDYFYRLGFPMLFFYSLIVCFCHEENDLRSLLYIYMFVMIWHAYLPVFNYLTGTHSFGHERVHANLFHNIGEVISGHVALANVMSQSLPVPYFLFFYEKNKLLKGLCIIAFILYIIAILASGSRGGFLGMVICIGLFVLKAKNKVSAMAMGVVLMIVFFAINPQQVAWYSTILEGTGADMSAHSRIVGLRNGIEMAIRRPLLGVGIGCFGPARGAWFGWSIWAHNHFGELIGELGLLGIITWGGFMVCCFKQISKITSFLEDKREGNELFVTLLNMCWVILVLRLILGMTTHSLLSSIWYLIGGIVLVTGRIVEDKYPELQAVERRQ